jgi:FtsZ-binding cell division protein ZapB
MEPDTLQQAGIVIGYPDLTYGGKRAMTRYEFAVAIARLLPLINKTPGAPNDMSGYALKSDLGNYATKDDLAALQTDVNNKLAANQAAIDALKALVDEFKPELEKLGQDVAEVQKRLDALEARVAAVEEEQRRVKITADINVIARSNINTSKTEFPALDQNGYVVGADNAAATEEKLPTDRSLFTQVGVLHDVLITIDGRVSDDAHAIVKLDVGNYLNTLPYATALGGIVSSESTDNAVLVGGLNRPLADGPDVLSVYNAYLDWPVSLGPLGNADAQVGRFGVQFTKYTLKAVNPDVYTNLPETDSGNYIVDGLKADMNLGMFHVNAFAGANPDASTPYVASAGPSESSYKGYLPNFVYPDVEEWVLNPISESAGARVSVGDPNKCSVGVTGVLAQTATAIDPGSSFAISPFNNVEAYSIDLHDAKLPILTGISLDAEGSMSPTGIGGVLGRVNSSYDNHAVEATLGYAAGAFDIHAGYQYVGRYFAAPGDWGRLGSWTNPTNISGAIVNAGYAFSPKLSLSAEGNFYQAPDSQYDKEGDVISPLDKNDKLNRYQVGLKYGLTSSSNVDLGYESVQYDLSNHDAVKNGILLATGEPLQTFLTLGVGHDFNKNASMKVMYQIINYNDKNTGFDGTTTNAAGKTVSAGNAQGGIALTQFDFKF